MTIKTINEDSKIILQVEGRVDTNTSPELQKKILEALQSSKELVIDFEQVPYISSAGLRALLLGQKTANSKKISMIVTNVSPMVMQVLKSVGFDKVLKIQ